MKTPKLVKLTKKALKHGQQESSVKKQNLLEIQHKLKKKAKKLKAKYEVEQDEELKNAILQNLAVISAQRKKIIKELRLLDSNDTDS
jgi:predicted negative regulator of RcsB-dependent stress response